MVRAAARYAAGGQPHGRTTRRTPMAINHHDETQEQCTFEIALVGDLTENEAELTDKLLAVPPHGECTLYIDSPGGSPYCAMSLAALIRLRNLQATGIVTG